MTRAAQDQIVKLMETYFEGLHQADSALLRQVFHPRLAYVCATEAEELYLDLETYMARVDARVPPAQRGDPRDEHILDIRFGSPRIAWVTAKMSMMGRSYLDHMTLVPHEGALRIVTKVFTYVPRED
ncbi:nuclear transport factor 2 family protein [Arenibacterium sp. LLYu02]|uniref:nuclear transport factor 2 family protein n=1 Tax=Arenibacterium sp. LLYu02 TaxID=3404132 RepID=UPI003B2168FC